jgi:hypothetical protein
LAAALILPAIAAIHGIVLAALHVDGTALSVCLPFNYQSLTVQCSGAVDMDIYGVFQICTIGILTAPASVRLSKTYFNLAGRNVLFIWTMLVVAGEHPPWPTGAPCSSTLTTTGLLALTVEFFRAHSSPCTDDGSGQPLYSGSEFPYGNTTCGLVCSVNRGPHSPMREGSADNIYVVPAPYALTFGAATLIAAACCVPGILSMVSIWDKVVRTNWAKQFGDPDADLVIEGTNGATVGGMKTVNEVIRRLLSVVEIPVVRNSRNLSPTSFQKTLEFHDALWKE